MNLHAALQQIRSCLAKMDTLYQKPVFDEWVVASLDGGKTDILYYQGPRPESFARQFHHDSGPLFSEMQGRHYSIGDFEFAAHAPGSRFDACLRVGEKAYLFCNNTYGSMAEIRSDARWREAQKPFVDLTDKIRSDPLA